MNDEREIFSDLHKGIIQNKYRPIKRLPIL